MLHWPQVLEAGALQKGALLAAAPAAPGSNKHAAARVQRLLAVIAGPALLHTVF